MTNGKYIEFKKRELHCHLCGALNLQPIKEICNKHGIEIPSGKELDDLLHIREPVGSMLEYFQPWSILKQLPRNKNCIEMMISSVLKDFKKDNIEYVELRYSPLTFIQAAGVDIDTALDWIAYSIQKHESYSGIRARLVLTMSRFNFDFDFAEKLLKSIVRSNMGGTIVGIDLVGDEGLPIPADASKLFRKAKEEYGLGLTVHAGETWNLENVRWAVDECGADRIGHGLAASSCEKMMDLLREKDVCVEVCLQSNYLTGNVKNLKKHPVIKFIEFGVPFVLCTDNPALQDFSLSDEYELFEKITGREDLLEHMISMQR
ncbi:hypothetical protein KAJ27_05460, partial [bacterium]|nr:hypothetical protein [bacterium]